MKTETFWCARCGNWLPGEAFGVTRGVRNYWCKACHRDAANEHREAKRQEAEAARVPLVRDQRVLRCHVCGGTFERPHRGRRWTPNGWVHWTCEEQAGD